MKTPPFKSQFLTLFFTMFLILHGCSSDSLEQSGLGSDKEKSAQDSSLSSFRITNTQQTAARNLFISMMQTSAYASYASTRNEFAQKMRNNSVFFPTKSQYMTWISANISSTAFGSVSAFSTAYDILIAKYKVLVLANPTLYQYIRNAEDDQIYYIIEPGLVPDPVQTNFASCATICFFSRASAYGAARSALAADLACCNEGYATDPVGMAGCTAGADQTFVNAILSADGVYFNCMIGCF